MAVVKSSVICTCGGGVHLHCVVDYGMVTAYVWSAPTGKVSQRDDTDDVIIAKSNDDDDDDVRPIFGQIPLWQRQGRYIVHLGCTCKYAIMIGQNCTPSPQTPRSLKSMTKTYH